MKTLKTTFLFFLLLGLSGITHAQVEDESENTPIENESNSFNVRPYRIGVKIGFPNTIGANLEYVTPLLDRKLSLTIDYSKLKSSWFLVNLDEEGNATDDNYNYSFFGAGFNYYFFKSGKGLYTGLGYGRISFDGQTTYTDDGAVTANEYFDFINNSLHVKLGARWGGLVYFRPEIGYSFNHIPDSVNSRVVSPDGTSEEGTYKLSDVEIISPLLSGFIFNIGFGFAF